MKKIFYSLFTFVAALSVVSCDYHDPNDGKFTFDSESGWVEFGDFTDTYVLSGAVTEFNVPVVLEAPVNKNGLEVYYTVTSVDGSIDAITYSGTAMVPAGELVGMIDFSIPATPFTSCTTFQIELTGTSSSEVQVGLDDNSKPITHLVHISSRDALLGTYDSVEDDSFNYETVVMAGDAPNEIVVSNVYGVDPASETHLFLSTFSRNVPGIVTYPYYLDNYLFTDTGAGDIYISNDFVTFGVAEDPIESTYDACNGTFDLSFFLVYGPAGAPETTNGINLVMTKQ